MKLRTLVLTAAAAIGAVVVGIVLWTSVGGDEAARPAALAASSGPVGVGALRTTALNAGNPLGVESYRVGLEAAGGAVKLLPLTFARGFDDVTIDLMSKALAGTSLGDVEFQLYQPGTLTAMLTYRLKSAKAAADAHAAGAPAQQSADLAYSGVEFPNAPKPVALPKGSLPAGAVGTLTVPGLPGPVAINAFSWAYAIPLSGGLKTAAPHLNAVEVTRPVDASSVVLWNAAVTGKALSPVLVELKRPSSSGPETYASYELSDAKITEIHHSGGAGGVPMESIALAFTKIKTTYHPSGGTPGPFASWNVATASP